MKTLIIYAHPYGKSFNSAILLAVKQAVQNSTNPYEVIDLYKDGFNGQYDAKELKLFKAGKTTDPLVTRYQKQLFEADKLVFIFPVWWNDVPAIVKGFIDKTMKKEITYSSSQKGVIGKLNFIKRVTVISTSTSPTWFIKLCCGNAIKGVFLNSTLKQLGVRERRWFNLGNIGKSTEHTRSQFLNKVKHEV